MSSNQKGAIAETAITLDALSHGIQVLRPVVEGCRYDLVFELRSQLMRVQCKWARLLGDAVEVRSRTSRRGPAGSYVRRTYSSAEVDAIAAYCGENRTCYLVPMALFGDQATVSLRLQPARNNQRRLVHWADEYRLGAIAQLGERHAGSVEVVGSSPTSST
jgi:hypothetical protein